MIDWLMIQNVVLSALLAGLFTWGCTILGSAVVFFFIKVSRKLLDVTVGFAVGVMTVAPFWSLLALVTDHAHADYGKLTWLPAAVGFPLGGFSLCLTDALVPHLYLGRDASEVKGIQPKKKLPKIALLFLAIATHNFPEGLTVGVTFGAPTSGNMTNATLIRAIGFAIGIGLQNIPERAVLSTPIRTDGSSHWRAFSVGTMSVVIEPVGAVLGAVPAIVMLQIVPYTLAFTVSATIFVVVEELISESQTSGNTDIATFGLVVGLVIMMVMDVALG